MITLGLDISTYTGWALFAGDDALPVCGTYRLPKCAPADYGTRGLALGRWLKTHVGLHLPNLIAFESPLVMMPGGQGKSFTTAHVIRLQIALATVIEVTARGLGVPCVEVATASAKKTMVGYGRKPKDAPADFDWGKIMMDAAKRRGWPVEDHHQADACAVVMCARGIE